VKQTQAIIALLHEYHSCDLCRGVAGEKGLHEEAIVEIRRLQKSLEDAASALNQVVPLIPMEKLKDIARDASARAFKTLEKERSS
jgi:hypothetical protein